MAKLRIFMNPLQPEKMLDVWLILKRKELYLLKGHIVADISLSLRQLCCIFTSKVDNWSICGTRIKHLLSTHYVSGTVLGNLTFIISIRQIRKNKDLDTNSISQTIKLTHINYLQPMFEPRFVWVQRCITF